MFLLNVSILKKNGSKDYLRFSPFFMTFFLNALSNAFCCLGEAYTCIYAAIAL